jgi:hypothetical protein
MKIIFCILSPVIVAVFMMLEGYPDSKVVFMNGQISIRHSYMESECRKCHVPWKGVSNQSCIECHVDDRHYIVKYTEYADTEKLRCFDCHQEHRGRSYDIEAAGYFIH